MATLNVYKSQTSVISTLTRTSAEHWCLDYTSTNPLNNLHCCLLANRESHWILTAWKSSMEPSTMLQADRIRWKTCHNQRWQDQSSKLDRWTQLYCNEYSNFAPGFQHPMKTELSWDRTKLKCGEIKNRNIPISHYTYQGSPVEGVMKRRLDRNYPGHGWI